MAKPVKDTLYNNLPEFLQGEDNLVAYTDAAGDFLEGTREAIEQFKWSHDYKNASTYGLQQGLKEIGFEIPPNIERSVSRVVLRDAIQMFVKKGTLDSLFWVLRILGVQPSIREAWIPSPDKIKKGFIRRLGTGEVERYDVSQYTYTDMIYGEVDVGEDGTFLTGYKYEDIYSEEPIHKIPIIGEQYKDAVDKEQDAVAKSPYIIIRINNQDFNVATDSYEDPETGELYEYAPTEQYRALVNLIEYFLFDTARPSNVRVMIVATLHELTETVVTGEEFEQITTNENIEDEESVIVGDVFHDLMLFQAGPFFVGDPLYIGKFSPYTAQNQAFNVSEIAEIGRFAFIFPESFQEFSVTTVVPSLDGNSRKFPLFINTHVMVELPNDSDIEIYGLNSHSDDYSTGVLLDPFKRVLDKDRYWIFFEAKYHSFYIKSISPITEKFNVYFDYKGGTFNNELYTNDGYFVDNNYVKYTEV